MKKIIALMLVLALCLVAPLAMAETIQVEEMLLDNGLCFVAPADWTQVELDADDYEDGYLMMVMDERTDRSMVLTVEEGDPEMTTTLLAEVLSGDKEYAGAQQVTNDHEAELVLYALADQTMMSYCILDEAGNLYNFSFLNTEGETIARDTALMELVDTCMANTYFDEELTGLEDAAEEEEPAAQVAAQGEIALKMVAIQDGPTFPIPADWDEGQLSNSDVADGAVAAYTDEATGRNMLIMASEVGPITTAQLAEILTGDADYANVRLMTNEYGLDMVLTVSADLTSGGYCFMDGDGWLYQFIFGLDGDTVMTDDAALAQLVQDCMANTCFED